VATLAGPATAQGACAPTAPDAEGPFYEAGAPLRQVTGRGLVVAGTVRTAAGCAPVASARIEWWSANRDGRYDQAHRASQLTDDGGRYRYETDPPGRYPGRPPHLHVRVTAPGYRPLVTQLYPKSGEAALQMDFVLPRE
jgi:protocatechuate 3,4-dioxygenase beta subunit